MQPLTKSEGTTSALGESHTMPMVVAKWRRSAGLWTRALGIGAVAGMRSMMPVALLAAAANRGGLPHIVSASTAVQPPWALLRTRSALAVGMLAAMGELVVGLEPTACCLRNPGCLFSLVQQR